MLTQTDGLIVHFSVFFFLGGGDVWGSSNAILFLVEGKYKSFPSIISLSQAACLCLLEWSLQVIFFFSLSEYVVGYVLECVSVSCLVCRPPTLLYFFCQRREFTLFVSIGSVNPFSGWLQCIKSEESFGYFFHHILLLFLEWVSVCVYMCVCVYVCFHMWGEKVFAVAPPRTHSLLALTGLALLKSWSSRFVFGYKMSASPCRSVTLAVS